VLNSAQRDRPMLPKSIAADSGMHEECIHPDSFDLTRQCPRLTMDGTELHLRAGGSPNAIRPQDAGELSPLQLARIDVIRPCVSTRSGGFQVSKQ
jgi:hypothetical protein